MYPKKWYVYYDLYTHACIDLQAPHPTHLIQQSSLQKQRRSQNSCPYAFATDRLSLHFPAGPRHADKNQRPVAAAESDHLST